MKLLWSRASLSVRSRLPTLLHGPGCNFGEWWGMPLVVHYWADLQSVHWLHCYGNITQTPNVSEYMIVLALCLVTIVVMGFNFTAGCQQGICQYLDYLGEFLRFLAPCGLWGRK